METLKERAETGKKLTVVPNALMKRIMAKVAELKKAKEEQK